MPAPSTLGMTDPARVGDVLPSVLGEVVDRAGHGYDRWAELVAQAGYCHHPIRLAGRVEHADRQTGEVRQVYDSEAEPDGVLLKACGTRRETRCPHGLRKVSRLDLLRGVKTHEARTIRLPRSVAEELGAYLAGRPHGRDDLVFTAPRGGPLRESKFVPDRFKPAIRAANQALAQLDPDNRPELLPEGCGCTTCDTRRPR
jgi:hypothetical protein